MYSEKVMKEFRRPHNIGEIKNPDGLGKIGNPVCLVPETKIHANDEFTKIDEITAGIKVLGHDGLYNEVVRIPKRSYSGKLLSIKNKLGKTIVTPEHEVLAVKVPKRWKYTFSRNKKTLPIEWHHADELSGGDLSVYPIMKEEKNVESIEFKQVGKKWDFRSKKIPEKIGINDDFLRLAGYYLAEGGLRDLVTKTLVSFSFNLNEEDLANDVVYIVKNNFGIEAKKLYVPKRNTLIVNVNSVWFVRLFKSLFGKGAAEKKLPHWMMLLPAEKQKSLIYGLWKGDGYFNEKRPRACYATISYQLTQQIVTLLLRQKIAPSIYIDKPKISKDGVKHQKAWRIHIGERKGLENLAKILGIDFKAEKPELVHSWFDENYLYTLITDIEKFDYNGAVVNLEVANSMSYTTESLCVHNCGDLMWVYIKVGKNKKGQETIKDIKVKTFGCVAALATSSKLTEMAKGMMLEDALKINKEKIAKELDGLPPNKMHCSVLAMDGLKRAIEDYRNKRKV
ncbi:MAG: iron-sulfur cluster assembly scaffold protein [Candidatus Diapherotrites archaeon]|nr:iron-sulfur cluster assembly scaffold protein [Candidatus Diapherotrites archaeon]